MKKTYEAPIAEKMQFDYEENVVASGTGNPDNGNQKGCGKFTLVGQSNGCQKIG